MGRRAGRRGRRHGPGRRRGDHPRHRYRRGGRGRDRHGAAPGQAIRPAHHAGARGPLGPAHASPGRATSGTPPWAWSASAASASGPRSWGGRSGCGSWPTTRSASRRPTCAAPASVTWPRRSDVISPAPAADRRDPPPGRRRLPGRGQAGGRAGQLRPRRPHRQRRRLPCPDQRPACRGSASTYSTPSRPAPSAVRAPGRRPDPAPDGAEPGGRPRPPSPPPPGASWTCWLAVSRRPSPTRTGSLTSGPARRRSSRKGSPHDRQRDRGPAPHRCAGCGPDRRLGHRPARSADRSSAGRGRGPGPPSGRGLRPAPWSRAGAAQLRRRAGRPGGRGDLQSAGQRPARPVEPGRHPGRQTRALREAVRQQRR